MRATVWVVGVCCAGAAVLVWTVVRWPDTLSRYLAPVWATGVAAYSVYLLTSFRHVVRSTGLLLLALEEQLGDNRAIVASMEGETTYGRAESGAMVVGVPARRPYLSAWDLFLGAQTSYQVSDALVRAMLRLRRKLEFLSRSADELDAATTQAVVRQQAHAFDFKGGVGFVRTLAREALGMVDDAVSLVRSERTTLVGRVVMAQVMPLGGAVGLLAVVLLAGSYGERARAEAESSRRGAHERAAVVEAMDAVRARRFELVDRRGAVRGVLSTADDGSAGLVLVSREGEVRATVTVDRTGGAMVAVNSRGRATKIGAGVSADGTPVLAVVRDGKSLWAAP